MKSRVAVLAMVTFGFSLTMATAQPAMRGPSGVPRPAPRLSGYMARLFAGNSGFTATLEFQSFAPGSVTGIIVQGKLSYLNGESRFEIDTPSDKDPNLPPLDSIILGQIGMDRTLVISCPDKNADYFVYPGLKAYVQSPLPPAELTAATEDYSVNVNFAGDENVMGQNCVKNNVTVTGADGVTHELTVWNATDLNNFPIKIETTEGDSTVIMLFRDLVLGAPDAAQFAPPSGFKKYTDFANLVASRGSNGTMR
jgi:hypothetical protein